MKVLVVDDHALIREAMRGVLHELRADAAVIEADCAAAALAAADAHPDLELVLLDVDLPDGDGLQVLDALRRTRPAAAVVMLSGLRDRGSVTRALATGAQGFIPKSEPRAVLLGALGLVLAGGVYVPTMALGPADTAPLPGAARAPATPSASGLTERQLDVLALMMRGRSNKLICRELDLAEPTVKNHVSAILRTLGVSSRTEAVVAANALGWDLSGRP
ncbi:MAG: response regulator transcription factor [Burkholderiaceae bacterium]|jgi:DNA-binding NarL/FixJ family response regulator|nr:response regulator transcription factor [Burkholderiales bacterium]MCZ8339844.1 response regulator transcription factor [Burkholderiaceae bacterium]